MDYSDAMEEQQRELDEKNTRGGVHVEQLYIALKEHSNDQAARIAALEGQLREREARNGVLEAECERLRVETRPASLLSRIAMLEARLDESRLLIAAAREAGAREFAEFCVDEESQGLWYRPHLMGMLARFLVSGTGNAGEKDGGE